MKPTPITDAAEKARQKYLDATNETGRVAYPESVPDGWGTARMLETLLGEARESLVKARERIKYADPKIRGMQEIDETLARIDAALDPDNLEGPPRTRDEMAADARELNRIAPTPAEKFALMFGGIPKTEQHREVAGEMRIARENASAEGMTVEEFREQSRSLKRQSK